MRRAPALLAAIAAGAVLAPGSALPAQRAPNAPFTRTLTKPDVEYAEPMTAIAGVRELRDGRVIVSDRIEKTVQLLDLARGTATPVAKEGGGPNEFALPAGLFALPGDSTLLFDMGNMRYLVIGPDGTPVRTFSTMDPNEPDMRLTIARGSDGNGNLYFLDRGMRMGPDGPDSFEPPDSGTVVRYDIATKKVTEVGRVALPKTTVAGGGSGGQVRVMMTTQPFAAQDDWTVGLDGRIAVVRHEPYRVEWLAPNGQRVVGPSVSYRKIPVTDADKEALRRARANPANGMRIQIGGGPGVAARGGDGPRPAMRAPEPTEWPAFKPPFMGNAGMVGPDGNLWVLRTRAADDEVPSHDVFDSYGKLVGTVKLPAGTRLVGFGRNSAYVVRTDEDDLQYLQRYKLF